jgi:hypothetical protein
VVLSIPLLADLAAGKSLDIAVALPASNVGQSSYLVVARVVPAGGRAPYPRTLFWLRSAPPVAGIHADAIAPGLSSTAHAVPTTRSR